MKNTILTITFIILSFISNSQVITVKLDTTQFFEHSSLISTTRALELGKLVYTDLYEHKNKLVVTYDLGKKIESCEGSQYKIIKINQSTNIIDVVVQEDSQESLVVLGKTDEGNIIYIIEYREGDLIKGFFTKNPEIIYN